MSIEDFSNIATALGIPLGLLGIALGYFASRKATDIQAVTTLSIHFQSKWERSWRALCQSGVPIEKIKSKEQRDDLVDALNWIDWLGILVQTKSFSNPALLLRSISTPLKQIIVLGASELNRDGPTEWAGVFEVAKWLRMQVTKNKIESS